MTSLKQKRLIAAEARERDIWHGHPPTERTLRLVVKPPAWIGEADWRFRRAADRRERQRADSDRRR